AAAALRAQFLRHLLAQQLPQTAEVVQRRSPLVTAKTVAISGVQRIAQARLDAVQRRLQALAVGALAPRGPEQVAVLSLDPGQNQGLRQPQTRRLVGQGTVLPDATLYLARGRHQAGGVVARRGQPVDADAVLDTFAERLGRDLGEAVQQDGLDAADGVLRLGLLAWPDDEAVVAAADVRPLRDDVQGGTVAV